MGAESTTMQVWIDQDLCTGDGLCEELAPAVFELHTDGLAYVKEVGEKTLILDNEGKPVHRGKDGLVDVPDKMVKAVIEAAEECPGECIFIEPAA